MKIETIYITWVCRRGLDGSRPLKFCYLARSDHGFNFSGFGKYNNPPSFSGFWQFPKGGHLSKNPTGNWNMGLSWGFHGAKIQRIYITWVCRRGLDGSRPLKLRYLARSAAVLTFGMFGKKNTHLNLGLQKFDNILYICIFGVRFRSWNLCFRIPTIRYLSFGRGVPP